MASAQKKGLPFPIVGQTYQNRSAQIAKQRTINVYPEFNEDLQIVALQGWPGLKLRTTLTDTGMVRGGKQMGDRLYVVSGTTLAELDIDNNETQYTGSIAGESPVIIDHDGINLVITTDSKAYTATAGGGAVTEISAAGLTNSAGFADRRFIYQQQNGQYATSDVDDPETINGQNFATAESFPDDLTRVFPWQKYIWLFGENSAEPWLFAGTGFPPYRINRQGVLRYGIQGRMAIGEVSDNIYFLDQKKRPRKLLGLQLPTNIGNPALGNKWDSYSTVSDCKIATVTFNQQDFVIWDFPSADATWVYSTETNWWFEIGTNGRYKGESFFRAFNINMAGGMDGKIFELDLNTYTDDSETILRQRDSFLISGDFYGQHGKRMTIDRLELVFETGVGIETGQGSDPEVMVQLSEDGGRTFGNEMKGKLGASGKDTPRVEFNALGQFLDVVIRLTVSDPVQFTLISANGDITFDDQ